MCLWVFAEGACVPPEDWGSMLRAFEASERRRMGIEYGEIMAGDGRDDSTSTGEGADYVGWGGLTAEQTVPGSDWKGGVSR